MRVVVVIALVAACKAAPSPPPVTSAAQPRATCATLHGRLIEKPTEQPLAGGVVSTTSGDMAVTDEAGRFVLNLTRPATEATITYSIEEWPVAITSCNVEWRVTRDPNVKIEVR